MKYISVIPIQQKNIVSTFVLFNKNKEKIKIHFKITCMKFLSVLKPTVIYWKNTFCFNTYIIIIAYNFYFIAILYQLNLYFTKWRFPGWNARLN